MYQFNLQSYFRNNLLRIFSLQIFLCFLLIFWVFREEWGGIYHSLAEEKVKILRQLVFYLSVFSIIHLFLKLFISDKAEKIQELIFAINANRNNFDLVRIIFGLCIIAPIVEECIYRWFVFKVFGKKNIFSYLISFFAFIFAHYCWRGESIRTLFLQYSAASFVLIYIYKESDWNLLPAIFLHSLINLLFIIITLISPTLFLI